MFGIDFLSAGLVLKALKEIDRNASLDNVLVAPDVIILDRVSLPGKDLLLDRLVVYWSGSPFSPSIDSMLFAGGTWKLSEQYFEAEEQRQDQDLPPGRFDRIEIIHGSYDTTSVSGAFSGKSPGDSLFFLFESGWGSGTGNFRFGCDFDTLHVTWFQCKRIPSELFTLPEMLQGFELEGNLSAIRDGAMSACGIITKVDGDPAEILFSMDNPTGEPDVRLSTDLKSFKDVLVTQAESLLGGDVFIDFKPGGIVTVEFMNSDTVRVIVDALLDSVRIYSPSLADDTVNTAVALRFNGSACLGSWEVDIDSGTVIFGEVPVYFDINGRFGQHQRLELRFWNDDISGEDLIESIPDELFGRLSGLQLGGNASFDVLAVLDWEVPDNSDFQASVNVSRVSVLASPIPVGHLRWRGSCLMCDSWGGRRTIYLDTLGNTDFVLFDSLHPSFEGILRCAEDATFRTHDGFCLYHIRNSIRANMESGTFVRGGSTISMQLARNLFLNRKKTFARKLQEVFLTWRLETYLSKDRILEIYANIVELGPDVFGFQEAARYYFNADLNELSTRQVAYLVSILPGPALYHRYFSSNNVPDYWEEYLNRLITISVSRGWIHSDSAASALVDSTVFHICSDAPER